MNKTIHHIRALSMIKAALFAFALAFLLSGAVSAGEKAQPVAVTFNDGWRWAYRARVVEMLKEDVYASGSLREDVFRDELGLKAGGVEGLLKEADEMTASLSHDSHDAPGAKAAVLEALIAFFDGTDAQTLQGALRLYPGTGYEPLGWYLLGDYYEKKGFYPEAAGYFNRLYNEAPSGAARTAGLFQLSRISYFKGEYEAAKEQFKEAARAGAPQAPVWLANTLLIKGELGSARAINSSADISFESADPLTLLSMGDMAVISGEFGAAREIFERLRSRYATDQFLSAFFELKKGDAYAAEGRLEAALELYRTTKENLNMLEGWAMASLCIADVYYAAGSEADLLKAYDLYATVSAGGYIGSEQAHLFMARTALKAGMFAKALTDAKDFPSGYPSSRLKHDMDSLVGELVVRWMDSLYSSHDYHLAAKLYIEHGESVPFGKKAAAYILAGKSYAALGLDSDAVNALDSAVKIARHEVLEDAMITLASVYISQKDWNSAERLVKAFKLRFPESVLNAEADSILLRAAFIRKDYGRAASSKVAPTDARGLMIKAAAYAGLDRLTEAIKVYYMALKALGANGDGDAIAQAYTGIGDASFMMRRYTGAIGAYRKAIEHSGPEKKRERAWALYRIAQSFESLEDADGKKAALDELKGMNAEISGWAEAIFKQEARM